MEIFDRYEVVLAQALAELDSEAGQDATAGERAGRLGDSMFRLCIEHGLDYDALREACITAFAGPVPLMIGRRDGSSAPFAAAMAQHHPLILLALEMMPPTDGLNDDGEGESDGENGSDSDSEDDAE